MTSFGRFAHTLNVVTLLVWAGLLVMTGITAATTFVTLKSLEPSMAGFAGVPQREHWSLVGGMAASRFFAAADVAGFICGGVASVTLIVLATSGSLRQRSRGYIIARVGSLGLLMMLFSYQLLVLGPRMSSNLTKYWTAAAKSEDLAAMARAKAAFDADHGHGSTVLFTLTCLVLFAGIIAAWPGSAQDAAGQFKNNS